METTRRRNEHEEKERENDLFVVVSKKGCSLLGHENPIPRGQHMYEHPRLKFYCRHGVISSFMYVIRYKRQPDRRGWKSLRLHSWRNTKLHHPPLPYGVQYFILHFYFASSRSQVYQEMNTIWVCMFPRLKCLIAAFATFLVLLKGQFLCCSTFSGYHRIFKMLNNGWLLQPKLQIN